MWTANYPATVPWLQVRDPVGPTPTIFTKLDPPRPIPAPATGTPAPRREEDPVAELTRMVKDLSINLANQQARQQRRDVQKFSANPSYDRGPRRCFQCGE